MWYKHSKHAVHFSEILDELKKKCIFVGRALLWGASGSLRLSAPYTKQVFLLTFSLIKVSSVYRSQMGCIYLVNSLTICRMNVL